MRVADRHAPWSHAANQNRRRRGKLSFSGKSELRYAATADAVQVMCERFDQIMREELGSHGGGENAEESTGSRKATLAALPSTLRV